MELSNNGVPQKHGAFPTQTSTLLDGLGQPAAPRLQRSKQHIISSWETMKFGVAQTVHVPMVRFCVRWQPQTELQQNKR